MSRRLSGNQFGFMKMRSTSTNLLTLSYDIAKNLDSLTQTDVIYTDFAKAFDRVDHNVLIKKLSNYGLSFQLFKFFQSPMYPIDHNLLVLRMRPRISSLSSREYHRARISDPYYSWQ